MSNSKFYRKEIVFNLLCAIHHLHRRLTIIAAIAAVRGQILESIFNGVTSSLHMAASPPKTLAFFL
jgi:hypothetical protein